MIIKTYRSELRLEVQYNYMSTFNGCVSDSWWLYDVGLLTLFDIIYRTIVHWEHYAFLYFSWLFTRVLFIELRFNFPAFRLILWTSKTSVVGFGDLKLRYAVLSSQNILDFQKDNVLFEVFIKFCLHDNSSPPAIKHVLTRTYCRKILKRIPPRGKVVSSTIFRIRTAHYRHITLPPLSKLIFWANIIGSSSNPIISYKLLSLQLKCCPHWRWVHDCCGAKNLKYYLLKYVDGSVHYRIVDWEAKNGPYEREILVSILHTGCDG